MYLTTAIASATNAIEVLVKNCEKGNSFYVNFLNM